MSVCSPGSAATQRLPPGPRRLSKTCSMGCAGSSEVTCTVAVAAISIAPGSGIDTLGGAFTICFRSMTPPSPSESAGEEQHDEDNQQHPGEARGPIAIGVIAPVGQPAKQEHQDDNQQQETHGKFPP